MGLEDVDLIFKTGDHRDLVMITHSQAVTVDLFRLFVLVDGQLAVARHHDSIIGQSNKRT